MSKVQVEAVTSSIDENILAENIKKDIEILGVIGTFEGGKTSDIVADYSNVTQSLGANEFRTDQKWYAKGVTKLNLPSVTTIGNYFCYNNSTIKEVRIPLVTSLGQQAFYKASSLELLDASSLTNLPISFLYDASSLRTLLLPWKQVESIGSQAFYNCSYQFYNFPQITVINLSVFRDQHVISYINSPLVETLEGDAWHCQIGYHGGPIALYLPSLTAINGTYNFYSCESMIALILKTPNCTLANSNSFQFNDSNIYVPNDSLEDYKSATNWASLSSRIFGYEEETSIELSDTFTPNPTASNIISWDYISVNEAECTQDSSTGAITITGVGVFEGIDESSHILVRGLDADDNPVYCGLVHISQEEED